MGRTKCVLPLALCAAALSAQTRPVIDPRGVTNAFTMEPAPARVGLGGLIQITGLNLGPPEGAKAAATPWPTELGDVRVSIGGKQAPLSSVEPGKILAQVPADANTGLADVIVERAGQRSLAARVFIDERRPSVKTADASGYGEAAGVQAGSTLTIAATGLGATDDSGNPKASISAYVGGFQAKTGVAPAAARQGEFDVSIEVPVGARRGDVIHVFAERQAGNRTTMGALSAPDVQVLQLPEDAPNLVSLVDTDLNGNFLMANGARDDNGCYPAVLVDFIAKKAAAVPSCLTAANRNAPTPLVAPNDGAAIGALVGPPQGEPPNGISAKVQIFSSAADPLAVELSGAASQLLPAQGGDFSAIVPGTPAQVFTIDGQTGAVTRGGAQPGLAGGFNVANLRFDLDGLTHLLGVVQMANNRVAILAGDDADEPKMAKFAVVNPATGAVLISKDFPEGWAPLLGPLPPNRPGAPALPPGAVNIAAIRATLTYDNTRQVFYALSRMVDNSKHGFIAFTQDNRTETKTIAFPDGWFAPACSANLRVFSLELSRRLAMVGTTVLETEFKQACPGTGFLLLDLTRQTIAATPLQAGGQVSANGAGEINDYIFSANLDPSRGGQTADSVYVLDGVTGAGFSIGLPSGVNGFTALQPIAALGMLAGAATNRQQGDQGLVLFDLDQAKAQLLPIPEGYASVTELGVLPATRKMIGRALRPRGTQLVIYDLVGGNITPVPNPEGVASIGPPPQQQQTPGQGGPVPPGGGGQQQQAAVARLVGVNPKANTVAGVAYNAEGGQVGVVVVRVP